MELKTGVNLHLIQSQQFKTQRIKVRFSAPIDKKNLAERVILANMLETANKDYPTPQKFRQKLASLFGASFVTQVGKRGAVHYIDIDLIYLAEPYTQGRDLTVEMLDFLKSSLLSPLTQADSFKEDLFKVEQKNLLSYLETEIEDSFIQANQAINQLFYQTESLQLPKYSRPDLVRQATPQTAFRALQRMLKKDQIDIYCLGQFDQEQLVAIFDSFSFDEREPELVYELRPNFSNVMREKIEQKSVQQSVLQLAYHVPVIYGSRAYYSLVVLNGLLGAFAHSKLFVNIREAKGLAYTIGSEFDSLTACLKIYAGIDRKNRQQALKLIHQQWMELKSGLFSDEDFLLTKQMLKNNIYLAEDRQFHLIEEYHLQQIFTQRQLDVDNKLTMIDRVSKYDVKALAKQIKLQALYFLEGDE